MTQRFEEKEVLRKELVRECLERREDKDSGQVRLSSSFGWMCPKGHSELPILRPSVQCPTVVPRQSEESLSVICLGIVRSRGWPLGWIL